MLLPTSPLVVKYHRNEYYGLSLEHYWYCSVICANMNLVRISKLRSFCCFGSTNSMSNTYLGLCTSNLGPKYRKKYFLSPSVMYLCCECATWLVTESLGHRSTLQTQHGLDT